MSVIYDGLRLSLVAAGVAAVLAACGGGSGGSERAVRVKRATTTSSTTKPAPTFGPGECITWDQDHPTAPNVASVACEGPHLMEVLGTVEATGAALYPATSEWSQIIATKCVPLAAPYLGGGFDPHGRYVVGNFHDLRRWTDGDRSLVCGLMSSVGRADESNRADLIGRADGHDQGIDHPVGTCLGTATNPQRLQVTDCAGPHGFEVTGRASLADWHPAGITEAAIDERASGECVRLGDLYLGRAQPGATGTTQIAMSVDSWNAGTRTVVCLVGAISGSDWQVSNGPLRGV